jgi:hypothetical protein
MKKAYFRFYEELNDFLPEEKRKQRCEHRFIDRASVKDMIEAIGVPHTEIDLIIINGVSSGFEYIVGDGDDISVYPEFESLDISSVQHLRPEPLREPKFVLDVHLGKLARYLRMLGFDSAYGNNLEDEEIVNISLNQKRTILTRDRGILKRSAVTRGYFVRYNDPEKQLAEVVGRFDLKNKIREFSRCLECNGALSEADKEKVSNKLPPNIKKNQEKFKFCNNCGRVYWSGSHVKKMTKMINDLRSGIL